MPNENHFFLVYVLGPGPGPAGPWGYVLVEIPFRAGQHSIRAQAGLVAQEAGRRKWGGDAVLPFNELVPQPCICDAQLPESPDYENSVGRAWVVPPEFRRSHISLSSAPG